MGSAMSKYEKLSLKENTEKLNPDLRLIQPLAQEDRAKTEDNFPVGITIFKNGKYKLVYVSANHSFDINSPTRGAIRKAIKEHSPKSIVVEAAKLPPQEIFSKQENPDSIAMMEPFYTAALAAKNNIDIAPGEPGNAHIFEVFEKKGYSKTDFQAYMWAIEIFKSKNSGDNMSEFFKNNKDYFSRIAKAADANQEEMLLEKGFKAWHAEHFPDRRNCFDIDMLDIVPHRSASAQPLQKMAYAHLKCRDDHIVRTITDKLNQFETVLVVYGAAHLRGQQLAFEKMIGPGKFESAPSSASLAHKPRFSM